MTYQHEDNLIEITINTHVPSKWRFVDLETGDVWKYVTTNIRGTTMERADVGETLGVLRGAQRMEESTLNTGSGITVQQQALLSFMEYESEARWCAGWLIDLHKALETDDTYKWLVSQAGGHWEWDKDAPLVNGRCLKWVPLDPN